MARKLSATIVLALLAAPLLAAPANGAPPPNAATCVSPLGRDVVIVFDHSASMLDQGKLSAGKNASNALLATLSPAIDQSALVSFSTGFQLEKGLNFSHVTTQQKVNALTADGATSLGGAVRMARYELDNGGPAESPPYYSHHARPASPHIMVVLTDGDQTIFDADPEYEANASKAEGVTVITVALGTAISANGLKTLHWMASTPSQAFVAPDATTLTSVFATISYQLNDTQNPTVSLASPVAARFLRNGVDSGPTPLGVPTILGTAPVGAIANDDCVLDHVDYAVDGAPLATAFTAPFNATLDCEARSAGNHTLRATAVDWLGKTTTTNQTFACVRAFADARSQAARAQATDPAAPLVLSKGARLGGWLPAPGSALAESTLDHVEGSFPDHYDASALWEHASGTSASGSPNPGRAFAASLTRQANVTYSGARADALETNASAAVDASTLSITAGGARQPISWRPGALAVSSAICSTSPLTLVGGYSAQLEDCYTPIVLGPGVVARAGEIVTVTSAVSREVTVDALRILVDRPEGRAELVLSESYAGASWLGSSPLRGPARVLDLANDAGSGRDAPDTRLAAMPLAPGVYGARIENQSDVDAYAITALTGQKVRATLTPSTEAVARLGTLPTAPTPSVATASLFARLLDPAGVVRDGKGSLTGGAPVPLELNVDVNGTWVILVSGNTMVNYTLDVEVVEAPMTHANDALMGIDAGNSCADALLVGPGNHVGTLEDGDPSDWYSVPATEGQALAFALRPGDTADAATMHLALYDPLCHLIAYGVPTGIYVKGSVEIVNYAVPTAQDGNYRAAVTHANGLGMYELTLATSVATTP